MTFEVAITSGSRKHGADLMHEAGTAAAPAQTFAAEAELAHMNRVLTMGQLTATIVHEVNQPIAGMVINAQAALRWLGAQPRDLEEVAQALARIVAEGNRARDLVGRARAHMTNAPPRREPVDLNHIILGAIALIRSEAVRHGAALRTRLATNLPRVRGDRVQLEQVMVNLIVNAIDAMKGLRERSRELLVTSMMTASRGVVVTVRDSGPGLQPESVDRLFDAFYTTKPGGMGMGLPICRSIIEAHGGRLWATANTPDGAAFHFTLPAREGIRV